ARRDALRRTLIARIRVSSPGEHTLPSVTGDVTPFFVRLLRGTISMDRFVDHILALSADQHPPGLVPPRFDGTVQVEDLLTVLESRGVRDFYAQVVEEIRTYPIFGLRPFFENLLDRWGSRHPRFAVVLILDQFEELFTRFVAN